MRSILVLLLCLEAAFLSLVTRPPARAQTFQMRLLEGVRIDRAGEAWDVTVELQRSRPGAAPLSRRAWRDGARADRAARAAGGAAAAREPERSAQRAGSARVRELRSPGRRLLDARAALLARGELRGDPGARPAQRRAAREARPAAARRAERCAARPAAGGRADRGARDAKAGAPSRAGSSSAPRCSSRRSSSGPRATRRRRRSSSWGWRASARASSRMRRRPTRTTCVAFRTGRGRRGCTSASTR